MRIKPLNKNAGVRFFVGLFLIVLISFGIFVVAGANVTGFGNESDVENESNLTDLNESFLNVTGESLELINESVLNETLIPENVSSDGGNNTINDNLVEVVNDTILNETDDDLFFIVANETVGNETNEILSNNETIQESIDFDSMELIERGPYHNIYFNNSSGENIARLSAEQVNYLERDEYFPINTTILNEGCEFDYCVRKGIYFADFKEDSSQEHLVKFFFNESYIKYTPRDLTYVSGNDKEAIAYVSSVLGYSNENTFIYPSIYGDGLDLEYEYHNSFLKENLIIQNKSDLPSPNLNSEEIYLSLEFMMNSKAVGLGPDNSRRFEEIEIFLTGYVTRKNSFIDNLLGREEEGTFEKNFKWNKKDKLKLKG